MTEADAQEWVDARFDAAAVDRLRALSAIVVDEAARQNLVAPSTLDTIWARHIVDSLQLVTLANGDDGHAAWLDIGTGAGFPGLAVAAALPERQVILVEPRRLRAEYLASAASKLDLPMVTVHARKVERVAERAGVISARAVAAIDQLFGAAMQCADNETIWLLPKGKSATEEVARARQKWHGLFHVEQSITDPQSHIVVAREVKAR
jgi:16S rRNA (guanine527-N7)-methyltransferase